MIRPTHCPYCSEHVERMRPYHLRQPPDEQSEPFPNPGVSEETSTPDSPSFKEVQALKLQPCGHIFRESDIEAVELGNIRLVDLGERVVNPRENDE